MLFLDFRLRDVGGPVRETPRLWDGQKLLDHGLDVVVAGGEPIVFLLHGYNNSRDEGMKALEGFAAAARGARPELGSMRFVGVLWPGDSRVGFLSYPTEERSADHTARCFLTQLRSLRFQEPPRFVAHSLGSRVVLRTLQLLASGSAGNFRASQVLLMAAAVDHDCLARADRYRDGVRSAERLVTVASTEDAVLRYGFVIGDSLAQFLGAGYTARALGSRGPAAQPPVPASVVAVQIPSKAGVGHGDYLTGKNSRQKSCARLGADALTGVFPLNYL